MPSKRAEKRREIGHIERFFSGIAQLRGLPHVGMHETLADEDGRPCAVVIGYGDKTVEALFYDENFDISRPVYGTGELFSIRVSDAHLGRVLDGLGRSRDGLPETGGSEVRCFRSAPLAVDREPVTRPLVTGIKMVDSILPLGRGQRELIIGDRRTGKSAIAEDAVIHVKNADRPVFCVYVMCGGKSRRLDGLVSLFDEAGAMLHTTIVAADGDDSYAAQYLAPFVGCAIAEYFRDSGRDALVVYDDLSKHAKAYRDISLLLERAPGRETYPADIFSLHAGLLERAAQLSSKRGGGSLTALPIIETQEGDLTSYIPTNLISITDGQIYLERGLFERGFIPAINAGLSVSRLGAQVQPKPLKEVTSGLRLTLAQQRELQKLTQLETEISREAQKKIVRGALTLELLKQEREATVRWEEQVALFFAVEEGFFDDLEKEHWGDFEGVLRDVLRGSHEDLLARIRGGSFDDAAKKELRDILVAFKDEFVQSRKP